MKDVLILDDYLSMMVIKDMAQPYYDENTISIIKYPDNYKLSLLVDYHKLIKQ